MPRQYANFGEWDKLGFSKKSIKTTNDERKKNQKEKFLRCKKCGKLMTVVPNTNILICENITTIKETNIEGSEIVKTVKCDNKRFVDKEYLNYMEYLFY